MHDRLSLIVAMKKKPAHSFSPLLYHIRPFRKDCLVASFYTFLSKSFELFPEVLLGLSINTVVSKENSWLSGLGFVNLKNQLFLLGIATLLAYSFRSLFEYLYAVKWFRIAQRVQHNFRMAAFKHVQQSTMRAFSKQEVGNLLTVLNDDINQLAHFFEEGIDQVIGLSTSVILIGGVLVFLSPTMALLAMLPIPFAIYGAHFFQKKLRPLSFDIREKSGVLGARLASSLLGLLTVKSLVAEQIEAQKISQYSEAYKEANFRSIRWHALIVPILRLIILMGFLATLVYGGVLVWEKKLDVGAYSTIIFLTQRLFEPFIDVTEIIIYFQRVMASTARLIHLFKLPLEVSPEASCKLRGEITFDQVSFSYNQQAPVLHRLSFTAMPGQMVAFVGATGAGKSTLLKLLLGFYMPTAGKVLFDMQELRTLSLAALRRQIGFVSQEVFLFEGTIAENICYAAPNATQEQIIHAAKNAAAHEFILRLPEGYNTWIGEQSRILSGGQRQRIAIARALVRNPAILIFDEATSSVDNETELAIQESLMQLGRHCTILMIAHRLSTVKQADQIFVLKHGEIVEKGTHQTLLQQHSYYAHLWKLQTGAYVSSAAAIG